MVHRGLRRPLWVRVVGDDPKGPGRADRPLRAPAVASNGDPEGELVLEGADEHPVEGATYEIELAYLLGREHWGQGLATEAARAIVDHALWTLRPPRLICLFDPRNVASRRVAERVGFTFDREVLLDGERLPMHSLHAGPLSAARRAPPR